MTRLTTTLNITDAITFELESNKEQGKLAFIRVSYLEEYVATVFHSDVIRDQAAYASDVIQQIASNEVSASANTCM